MPQEHALLRLTAIPSSMGPTPLAPVQVNCLLPGAINTPFLDQVLNTPQKVDYILHRIPAGGWAWLVDAMSERSHASAASSPQAGRVFLLWRHRRWRRTLPWGGAAAS